MHSSSNKGYSGSDQVCQPKPKFQYFTLYNIIFIYKTIETTELFLFSIFFDIFERVATYFKNLVKIFEKESRYEAFKEYI